MAANSDRDVLNKFIQNAPRPVEVDGEKWENTLALLTMLTASLKKAMNENSIRNMKEQEEVMAKISEASRKDSEKKPKKPKRLSVKQMLPIKPHRAPVRFLATSC